MLNSTAAVFSAFTSTLTAQLHRNESVLYFEGRTGHSYTTDWQVGYTIWHVLGLQSLHVYCSLLAHSFCLLTDCRCGKGRETSD